MKTTVLAVTNGENTSFNTLGRQIEKFLPEFSVRVLPSNKIDSNTICDILLFHWWRPLSEGILGRVIVKKSIVLSVFDHHSWTFSPLYARAMKTALDRADYLVVGNELILDQLRQRYDAIPPAWICETGVDTKLFRALPYPDQFTALWCGNSRSGEGDLKGIEIVRESAEIAGVPLIVADSLGEIGEAVPYAEMPSWYRQGTVYMVGSRSEGTPRTLLEAMSCGRLACSTRVGVAPRLIQHGVNGVIVDRDPQAMAAGLRYLRNLLNVVPSHIPAQAARKSAEAFDVRNKIHSWRACLMTAATGKWWKSAHQTVEKKSPAQAVGPRAESEVSELQGHPMPPGECQKAIDEIDPGTPNRPTVTMCSTYRFLSRTIKMLAPLMDRYRFVMDDGANSRPPGTDLVWSLYPFADGQRALRIKHAHGVPFVMTARGQFWHLEQRVICASVQVYDQADAVTCLTQNLLRKLVQLCPSTRSKITVIPNGGYSGHESESVPTLPYKRPLIVMLTNFGFEGKRVAADQLAQAFEKVKFGGSVLFAGREGRFAPPRGRMFGATYLGFVKNRFALLRQADVFIYHSHTDGQPSSLMEAMSMGCPCVVGRSENSGASEFVRDGETGIVRSDVAELVAEAIRLTADRAAAKRLGNAAAKEMREVLTWESSADKYDAVFQSVLPSGKRRSR